MAELKEREIRLLEDRLKNLNMGLNEMGSENVMVNKEMLTAVRDYMAQLLGLLRRPAPENKPCADCSGIVYRQTNSGKIIPAGQRCGEKITPPCYHPDGDGCAYQIYGDNNDEPIDRCKACPLCYSDKVRHTAPENKALTHFQRIAESPEKLAAFVSETYGSAICPKDDMTCGKESTCEKCWLDWLNSPAEEENDAQH